MQSTRFSLNWLDLGKGVLVAFGTAFLTTATQWLNLGTFPTGGQLKIAAVAGMAAAVTYLIKNFLTDDIKAAEKVLDKADAKQLEQIKEAQGTKFERPAAPKDGSL